MIPSLQLGAAASRNRDDGLLLSIGGSVVEYGADTRLGIPKVAPSLSLITPAPYQVFQRGVLSNLGTVRIIGAYTGKSGVVEARWGDQEAWTVIDAAPVNGVFFGALTRPPGQRTLYVRIAGGAATASAQYVGVGDVYICLGQSNGSGRGTSLQSYTHPSLKASLLGNDDVWGNLEDPTDSGVNQVDKISYDGPNDAKGSVKPLIATAIMAVTGCPVAFIPCERGGNGHGQWQPPANRTDTNTLYGSAVRRGLLAGGGQKGGLRGALYWGGEAGVVSANLDYNAYRPIAQGILADLGVKVMRCKLQYCTDTNGAAAPAVLAAGVSAAVQYIWDHPAEFNSVVGPDLSDIVTDDGFHLMTTEKLQLAASRWASAILANF